MLVKDLREMLTDLPDDMPVVVDSVQGNEEYLEAICCIMNTNPIPLHTGMYKMTLNPGPDHVKVLLIL